MVVKTVVEAQSVFLTKRRKAEVSGKSALAFSFSFKANFRMMALENI